MLGPKCRFLHRNGEAIGRVNGRFTKPSWGEELVAGDTGMIRRVG